MEKLKSLKMVFIYFPESLEHKKKENGIIYSKNMKTEKDQIFLENGKTLKNINIIFKKNRRKSARKIQKSHPIIVAPLKSIRKFTSISLIETSFLQCLWSSF